MGRLCDNSEVVTYDPVYDFTVTIRWFHLWQICVGGGKFVSRDF
jgi:hypothetical protein